jgi:hypothetical protein
LVLDDDVGFATWVPNETINFLPSSAFGTPLLNLIGFWHWTHSCFCGEFILFEQFFFKILGGQILLLKTSQNLIKIFMGLHIVQASSQDIKRISIKIYFHSWSIAKYG